MFDPPDTMRKEFIPKQASFERHVPPLSPAEKRICALLLQRLTEKRIAEHIERSPNTVHVHVRNIYRKLGIRSRKQLLDYPGIVTMVISKNESS